MSFSFALSLLCEVNNRNCKIKSVYGTKREIQLSYPTVTEPVKLRLRNTQSSSLYKGRAEMQIGGGNWTKLCTSDNNMAKVVCRQLGLSS